MQAFVMMAFALLVALAATVRGVTGIPIDHETCDRIRPYHRRINELAVAQTVVGSVAFVLCSLVAIHILAYDAHSLPTRLVLGVIVANIIYASTDVVPTNCRGS